MSKSYKHIFHRWLALFCAVLILSVIMLVPVANAVASSGGQTVLDDTDWKRVKLKSGKTAFNMTPKNFYDAYNTVATILVDSGGASKNNLLIGSIDSINPETGTFGRVDINGSEIIVKGTSSSPSKGKIRRIEIRIYTDPEYSEHMSNILLALFLVFAKYDTDVTAKFIKKYAEIVESGKNSAFTYGTAKFTFKLPDSKHSDGFLIVTPK